MNRRTRTPGSWQLTASPTAPTPGSTRASCSSSPPAVTQLSAVTSRRPAARTAAAVEAAATTAPCGVIVQPAPCPRRLRRRGHATRGRGAA